MTAYLATLPSSVLFPAIDPATAANISNYSLILVNPNGTTTDESQFITTANFVAPTARARCDRQLHPRLHRGHQPDLPARPAGRATTCSWPTRPSCNIPGLTDAAGNPLDDTTCRRRHQDFIINFDVQPQPVYVTSMALESIVQQRRLDGHRRPAIVLRAAARPTGQLPATTWRRPHGRRHRLLQPRSLSTRALRSTTHSVQLDPVGRQCAGAGRRRLRHPGPRRPGQHRHRLHHPLELHRHPLQLQSRHRTVVAGHRARRHRQPAGASARPGQHADGRRLSALHPQPGRTDGGPRHADLRHLRQPARRRKPGQPDLDTASRVPQPASRLPLPGS